MDCGALIRWIVALLFDHGDWTCTSEDVRLSKNNRKLIILLYADLMGSSVKDMQPFHPVNLQIHRPQVLVINNTAAQ
jgi:hypothetical protein